MLNTMMPKQYAVVLWYFFAPFDQQTSHIVKVAVDKNRRVRISMNALFTYVLPVASRPGLISLLLKAAKKSSMGEAS